MSRPRQLTLLDALKRHEEAGTTFTLPELAAETGYKLSSVKTYHAKRFRDRLVFDVDGALEARGCLDLSDDEFLGFMDQAGPAELQRDGLYRDLLARADAAMGLAVELYHRPGAPGGLQNYGRLATEAWVLLLGAEFVRGQSPAVLGPLAAGHFAALDAALAESELPEELNHLVRGVAEIGNLSLVAKLGESGTALSGIAEVHCRAWQSRRGGGPDFGILTRLRRTGTGVPSPAAAELAARLVSLVPDEPVSEDTTQPLPSLVRQAAFAFSGSAPPEEGPVESPEPSPVSPVAPQPPVSRQVPREQLVLAALGEAGGPVDIDELVDAAGGTRAEVEAILAEESTAFRAGRTTWIEQGNLGLAPGALSDVVQWALEEMEGEDEPVTVASIMRNASDSGVAVEGLTPWLLRDALSRHPDVVTFTNPKIVAHIESFRDGGVGLLDRLESIVRSAGAEATFEEILAALPAGVTYHRVALAGLLQGARWCVRIGSGRYCHVTATGLDAEGRRALMDAAVAELEPKTTRTCAELLTAISATVTRPRVAEPARVLWGLLLADPRVQCGPGLRVALARDDAGIDLLIEGIVEVLLERGELGAQDVRRAATARYGYRGLDSFRGALAAAVDRGLVRRHGTRYACPR